MKKNGHCSENNKTNDTFSELKKHTLCSDKIKNFLNFDKSKRKISGQLIKMILF